MTVNHSWNIGGRVYDGVYPIDFDLGLDGEETEAGGQVAGSTSATLHIRGAYTTDEMKQGYSPSGTLWNHIDVALSGLRRGDSVLGLPDAVRRRSPTSRTSSRSSRTASGAAPSPGLSPRS